MQVVSIHVPRSSSWCGRGWLSLRTATIALVMGFTLTTLAGAQQASHVARVPVLVLLVDSLPVPDARAVIVRQSSPPRRDYILLTRNTATARQLSAAVFTLVTVHATAGTVPDRDALIRVQAAEGPTMWIETEERRAESIVRRLQRTNARHVPGFGFVPAVRLTVPAQAMQGRLQPKP
jgi:hypothetical protein